VKRPTDKNADPPEKKMVEVERVRQSEERFCQLVEQLPGITYIVELLPEPHTVYISPQVQPMLGFTQQEWLSTPPFWIQQVAPEDREHIVEKVLLHNQTAESFFLEYRVQTREGKCLWIRNSATYQRNAEGVPTTVHGVMQDISQRKRAEEALRDSEAEHQALVNAIPDLIFINTRDGEYQTIHAPHPETLLAPPEEIIHQNISDFLPPAIAQQCKRAIQDAVDSGHLQEIQYTLAVNGHSKTYEARVAPCGEDTAITIVRDITERKQAESTLEITKQSYLNLLNSITEAIYVQNPNGEFIDTNRGAELMYGYTREELLGKSPADVAAPGRNDLQEIIRLSKEVFETGVSARFPFWAVRKNGVVFPKDVVLNKGTYFGQEVLIAVARDISEQVNTEAEKERLQSQLLQAQKLESVGRLAGGVAHDFNNLLQAIFGNAELALDSLSPGSPAFDNVEEIRKTARRSAELTKQLLAFARKQAVLPRVLDLNQTIEGMYKMLRRLIGEDIQLEWTPQLDLPSVKIDPSQIDQILVNLCLNARDSVAAEGRVTIKTEAVLFQEAYCAEHIEFAPGEFVHLSVRDNGGGMEPGVLEHIFEPFFSTKKMGHGTGLGLATVYGIVQQNQGIIRAESHPGQGAAFHIYLPVCTPNDPAAAETEVLPDNRQGKESILVAEDDVEILRLTAKMLEQLGYSVSAAATPREAIRLATEHVGDLDLLITDVVMPEMNGQTLAQEIRALFPKINCLFMSGYTADIIASQGILDEGIQFFQKPFTRQELSAKVRTVLDSE
jgi:PAS domain S-box-containing protein